MTVVQVASHATPSLGSRRRRAVSHFPVGEGVTARCGALPALPLHSHRHPARGHGLQSPCTSSSHPLSLQSGAMSDLPTKKGANSPAWAPLGHVQPGPPAEDKPERCHCSSTEELRSAATRSEPREFRLCDFLQLII